MRSKRHRRKMNHVVLFLSDSVDGRVRQLRVRPWFVEAVILILCVLVGAVIGFIAYEEQLLQQNKNVSNEKSDVQLKMIEEMEVEKQSLEGQIRELQITIDGLNDKVQILSETVNQKTESEAQLLARLEKQSTPTEFPLTGGASMEVAEEGEPMLVFTASAGTSVVATASGTVTAVGEDEVYGKNIWVDHGNGYVTIYRNQGEPMVKVGDEIVQGSPLFIIDNQNVQLGYQMQRDGIYIDPAELLSISG